VDLLKFGGKKGASAAAALAGIDPAEIVKSVAEFIGQYMLNMGTIAKAAEEAVELYAEDVKQRGAMASHLGKLVEIMKPTKPAKKKATRKGK
jgi:hypothetical protein